VVVGTQVIAGYSLPPNTACSRPPIRAEFQGYNRVVIIVWGNGIIRRTLGGG